MASLSSADSLQLARFALDHANEGVFWIDAKGHLLYVNEAASRLLAFPSAELLSMSLSQICPELTPELWAQLLKETKSNEKFTCELSVNRKGNRLLPVEMTVYLLSLSSQEILCAYVRDVNEHKQLQQLKNEFVSTVSHELRTPMTIVRESVSQVLDGLLGEVPASQREALYITLSGIDRLARIINDLLDVSKMEAGKATLRWDRVQLADLIREVVETFSSRARERGLDLRMSLPAHEVIVYADYERLVQVFTNLVGNALKFSEKGHIEITVHEHDKHFECAVSDTGIGIPKEDLGRVFNKFEQLNQPALTGEKGSGLGLSICKGIVELHQGRIWAESKKEQGSTFFFTLPKRTAEELFKQRLANELTQAVASGGHLTTLLFEIQIAKDLDSRKIATLSGWAQQELLETLKAQGVRKTDFLLRDANSLWVILFGMNKKESNRIVELTLDAYAAELGKSEFAEEVHLQWVACSYPEEAKNQKDILNKLLARRKHAA